METLVAIAAIIAGLVGILGSIIPGLPGPPISWLGMFALYIWGTGTDSGGDAMSLTVLLVMLGVTTVVSVLDYIIPSMLTRKYGGSKAGSRGALIGMFIGIFCLPPWGILVGTMAGAFIGELYFAGKDVKGSLRSAWSSLLGFMAGTGLKLVATCVMFYYIAVYAF